MKRLIAPIALLAVLVILSGCVKPWVNLDANPKTGFPSFFDGGMLVTFSANGIINSINYGDGSDIGTALTHLYTHIGTYDVVAEVVINGRTRTSRITITVKNDPPEVYPPFIAGSYVQERGISLVDGRKQQHGCSGGGGETLNYGAWPRYGETFTYSWKITIECIRCDDLVVYGHGTDEYPLALISWHVGAATKIFPDLYPVPTIYGIWIPPNYTPQGCYPDPDNPWNDYPSVSRVAKGTIEMTTTNQFGCSATTTNVIDVYVGGGCL